MFQLLFVRYVFISMSLTCAMCIVHASRERGFYWWNKSIRTSAKWMNAERINSNLLRLYSRFRHCSVRSVHRMQSKIRKVVLSGWDLLIFRRRRKANAYGAERQRFGGVSEGNDVRECVCGKARMEWTARHVHVNTQMESCEYASVECVCNVYLRMHSPVCPCARWMRMFYLSWAGLEIQSISNLISTAKCAKNFHFWRSPF